MSECPYCQGELKDGHEWVSPLPDGLYEEGPQFMLSVFEGLSYIVTLADPEYDCGPINYCPMCGRDLQVVES